METNTAEYVSKLLLLDSLLSYTAETRILCAGTSNSGLHLRPFRAHGNDRDLVRLDRLQVRLREFEGHARDQEGPDIVAKAVSVEMALH